jgi:hypothetical protein
MKVFQNREPGVARALVAVAVAIARGLLAVKYRQRAAKPSPLSGQHAIRRTCQCRICRLHRYHSGYRDQQAVRAR